MKRLLKNKFLFLLVSAGIVLFVAATFFILTATATTKAVVLTSDAKAGTTVTSAMVKEVDIPKDTPGDFFKSSSSVVGERLTSNISKDQLIYPNDLMSSIEIVGGEENDDYVTTSITVPDSQAVGGLLTAGDIVDISVVPDDAHNLAKELPEFNINAGTSGGIYYILSNVTLLDTTTSVSTEQGSNLSATIQSGTGSNEASSTYLVSLSYNDFKKLRIADQYGKIYLNLSPKQNESNAPLLDQMSGGVKGGLTDAATGENAKGEKVIKDKEENKQNNNNNNNNDNNNNNNDNQDVNKPEENQDNNNEQNNDQGNN